MYRLAILHDPADPEPPSNPAAMRKFLQAAAGIGLQTELITRDDILRLPQFDALFIRDTTHLDHYTLAFAQRATELGLAVIDDPDSIIKCNDKVFLAELFLKHNIPAPRTLLIQHSNVGEIIPALGLPCVLKLRDSSFSLGVTKAESESELLALTAAMFEISAMLVAQEYLPTAFDWRVGILDRQPLFVCQYRMVPGHWQIIQHEADGTIREGDTVAIQLKQAPPAVVQLALDAANLIGNGLYGVDIKQLGDNYYVIEINDNINVDAGNEDGVVQNALYQQIMAALLRRIERA